MWAVYDYCGPSSAAGSSPRNHVHEWLQNQPTAQRAKLAIKFWLIAQHRDNERGRPVPFPPPWVEGPLKGEYRMLYDIKVQGGPSGANTRLLVCRGPQNNDNEITLLFGAYELNNEWEPKNAPQIAAERYEQVRANARFRCPHVWV